MPKVRHGRPVQMSRNTDQGVTASTAVGGWLGLRDATSDVEVRQNSGTSSASARLRMTGEHPRPWNDSTGPGKVVWCAAQECLGVLHIRVGTTPRYLLMTSFAYEADLDCRWARTADTFLGAPPRSLGAICCRASLIFAFTQPLGAGLVRCQRYQGLYSRFVEVGR